MNEEKRLGVPVRRIREARAVSRSQ
jgi:hypothetical protein